MALSRRDKKIAVIFTILLYGSIFGYVCVYPIIKFGGPSWPKIQDKPKLLQDCKFLLKENPDYRYNWSKIEDVNLPVSIKALSPIGVYGNKEFVDIRISGGGIGPGWGYIVFPNDVTKNLNPTDFDLWKSVYPGIFKYIDKEQS